MENSSTGTLPQYPEYPCPECQEDPDTWPCYLCGQGYKCPIPHPENYE